MEKIEIREGKIFLSGNEVSGVRKNSKLKSNRPRNGFAEVYLKLLVKLSWYQIGDNLSRNVLLKTSNDDEPTLLAISLVLFQLLSCLNVIDELMSIRWQVLNDETTKIVSYF